MKNSISDKALRAWIRQMGDDEFFMAFISRFEELADSIQNEVNNEHERFMLYERGLIMGYKNIRNYVSSILNTNTDTEQET